MALTIQIDLRCRIAAQDLQAMHRLRARVFKNRMGWEVPIMSGMEIDGYDALEPLYMLIRNGDGEICGCWRALPTLGPYMLKDSFAQLLHGAAAPEDPAIWELSRFAIDVPSVKGEQTDCFGFADVTVESIREMMAYGLDHKITHFVTVTTTAIERLMRGAGMVSQRLGPPLIIGVEKAVALQIDVPATFKGMPARDRAS